MRFSVALLFAAFTSTVSASLISRQSLPACVLTCSAQADLDGCQVTDNGCLCRSQKFVESSTRCIGQTCTGADLPAALDAAKQICQALGVTLTSTPSGFPTLAASSSGAAAAASTTATSPASGSGSGTATATGGAGASSSTPTSAASINRVNAFAGAAAFGLAVLAL